MMRETPIDERPEFQRRSNTVPFLFNMIFSLGVGIAVFLLLFLWNHRLMRFDVDFRTTERFRNVVSDELLRVASEFGRNEQIQAYSVFPDDAPIPITFAAWSVDQQINYLQKVGMADSLQARLNAGDQLRRSYDLPADEPNSPADLYYRKDALESWMRSGVHREPKPALIYFGETTLFVPRDQTEKLLKRLGVSSLEQATEQGRSIIDVRPDIVTMLREDALPIKGGSLLEATEMKLERYRATATSIENTLLTIRELTSVQSTNNAPSNLEYSFTFTGSGNVYTNKDLEKKRKPIWSAPVIIENGMASIGEGPWSKELGQIFRQGLSSSPERVSVDTQLQGTSLTFRIDTTMQVDDILAQEKQALPMAGMMTKVALGLLIVAGIGWAITLGITLFNTTNVDRPLLRRFESRLPLEVLVLLSLLFIVFFSTFLKAVVIQQDNLSVSGFLEDPYYETFWAIYLPLILIFNAVGWLLLSSFFRKARQGRFYEGSLIDIATRGVRDLLYSANKGTLTRHQNVKLVSLGFLLILLPFIVMLLLNDIASIFLYLPVIYLIFRYALKKDASEGRLLGAMQGIATGELGQPLREEDFIGIDQDMARAINQFDSSLSTALAKNMKSERLQTELISNVSHDIRTPLTSIINYVDLLRNSSLSDDEKREYLAVLEKKSMRLKVLMNDLIDVSKASSGAVDIHLETINLEEVVGQSLAELETGWEARSLEPIVNVPELPVYAHADGQKLARVLENLITNAQKYSLPGSRVYLCVDQTDSQARFSIKNVSEAPLNMSADEMLERFKRGDVARTSEGSGLGLSISENLMRHMGGRLLLDIDGDLFKATAVVPLA